MIVSAFVVFMVFVLLCFLSLYYENLLNSPVKVAAALIFMVVCWYLIGTLIEKG